MLATVPDHYKSNKTCWCWDIVFNSYLKLFLVSSDVRGSRSMQVFSYTQAIVIQSMLHCTSNRIQRFQACIYVLILWKISALVKNACTFSSYFIIFLCNNRFLLLLILATFNNVQPFLYTRLIAEGDSADFWLQLWSSSSGNATIYNQKTSFFKRLSSLVQALQ